MKIYVRHGNYIAKQRIEGNYFSILSEAGIAQILEAREKLIRICEEGGKSLPRIAYCSFADRAIETAILLLDGHRERLDRSRKEVRRKLEMRNKTDIETPEMYMAVGPWYFDNIEMKESLTIDANAVKDLDADMIVVLHQPSAQRLRLKLGEGEFEIVD